MEAFGAAEECQEKRPAGQDRVAAVEIDDRVGFIALLHEPVQNQDMQRRPQEADQPQKDRQKHQGLGLGRPGQAGPLPDDPHHEGVLGAGGDEPDPRKGVHQTGNDDNDP
ncbi:MAG: hypothetical protein V1774_00105 [Candidatus Eisenbacteria bacterium]